MSNFGVPSNFRDMSNFRDTSNFRVLSLLKSESLATFRTRQSFDQLSAGQGGADR